MSGLVGNSRGAAQMVSILLIFIIGFQILYCCLFRFYGPSRLFHSFWAESIIRWGENGRFPPKKHTRPPVRRTWLVSHVTRARLEPIERFWALKISVLNHSATGAAGFQSEWNNIWSARAPPHPHTKTNELTHEKRVLIPQGEQWRFRWALHPLRLARAFSVLTHNMSCLMTKPTKWLCAQLRQISLGICPVWSESSLCAQWVTKDPSFLHADSEDSGETGRMPRLIWVFAGRTQSFCWFCHEAAHICIWQ